MDAGRAMRRTPHYSRSPPARRPAAVGDDGQAARHPAPEAPGRFRRLRAFAGRHDRSLLVLGSAVLAALLAVGLGTLTAPPERRLTQGDIDAAVVHTLKKRPRDPSDASRAYDVIRPSVVLVRRLGEDPKASGTGKGGAGDAGPGDASPGAANRGEAKQFSLTGVGTGVVFSEDGMIFTNLHVVAGADDIGVVFADGTESEVELLDAQPENDLAVLRAKTLPDDLRPATLRSTRGLKTGDEVMAVGFPFGIGPTATWGVVSGLRREHYSEEGRRNLIDLIQFDAAANPGNSGGPLVTREGDVVGIVTSILNPTDVGFFVGIAFAVPIENAAKAAGVSPF
jgi:S1-C subfamily serine protease